MGAPDEEVNWPESIKMWKCVGVPDLCDGAMQICPFAGFVWWCYQYFLAPNVSSSVCSHVALLFSNE